LGTDGVEDYATINTFAINEETGEREKINDLAVGTFDTTITLGPSFATKRQEAADTYQQLLQGNPEIWGIAGDLIFKSMDLPYADEIAERLRSMLPPQIQNMINDDKDIPPEVQAMMQQAQQAMQLVEAQMQEVQQAAQESELAKAEVEKLIANLKTGEAQFKATIATEMAKIAEKDSRLTIQKINDDSEGVIEASRQQVAGEAQEFNTLLTGEISANMQAFSQLLAEQVAEMQAHSVQVIDAIRQEKDEKPKIVKVTTNRVDGKLEAIPVYEDEPTQH